MLGQTHVCTHTGYDFGDEHQQPWERKTHTVVQHELIHAPGGSWPSHIYTIFLQLYASRQS